MIRPAKKLRKGFDWRLVLHFLEHGQPGIINSERHSWYFYLNLNFVLSSFTKVVSGSSSIQVPLLFQFYIG
jgi:hypothetical protein